ncbi:hypothetical protein ACP2AV_01180 [Aliiroseovarius sp. PTFE2010]|uniref:hypothetical protein n=1 Tax=Aliiroseovarius sp. PTFE2010 TaxID=3417190 RepID=UPI003CF07893
MTRNLLQPHKHVPGRAKHELNDFELLVPDRAGKSTGLVGSPGAVCEGYLDDDPNSQGRFR